jgi:hypothetical protein
MSISRVVAVLALVAQGLNLFAGAVGFYKPGWALVAAAGVAGIQAFTARVQGSSATARGE